MLEIVKPERHIRPDQLGFARGAAGFGLTTTSGKEGTSYV